MLINKAILHILDFTNGLTVVSKKPLNLGSIELNDFLEKHITKALGEPDKHEAAFKEGSDFFVLLDSYAKQGISFQELSEKTAEKLRLGFANVDEPEAYDLLVADYSEATDHGVALMLFANKTAYTHRVVNEEEVHNEIIPYRAILPAAGQKLDSFALFNLTKGEMCYRDKKRVVDGEAAYLLPDFVLQCEQTVSAKEAVKAVAKITNKVAAEAGMNPAEAVAKAKTILNRQAEPNGNFSPAEIGRQVFNDAPALQQEFVQSLEKTGMPEEVRIDPEYAAKTAKCHKLKTDTGIEMSIPAEYFESNEFMEFVNNSDGTISIELKKIGRIMNRLG